MWTTRPVSVLFWLSWKLVIPHYSSPKEMNSLGKKCPRDCEICLMY